MEQKVLQRKVNYIAPTLNTETESETAYRQIRVAAYCRVSTQMEEQLNSYEVQVKHYTDKINSEPKWSFAGIYADKGISGKSMYRRPRFLAMIKDAKEGKFDAIFTKSVSRLGRNTTQVLETIGELRDRGIGVFFEKENIDTLNPNSQLYLTIAASIAENDLCVDAARPAMVNTAPL